MKLGRPIMRLLQHSRWLQNNTTCGVPYLLYSPNMQLYLGCNNSNYSCVLNVLILLSQFYTSWRLDSKLPQGLFLFILLVYVFYKAIILQLDQYYEIQLQWPHLIEINFFHHWHHPTNNSGTMEYFQLILRHLNSYSLLFW